MTDRQYIRITFMTAVTMLVIVMLFNFTLDPFCIFNNSPSGESHHYKPAVYQRVRLLKSYEVRSVKPDSILLGTSRSHLGIRPSHPLWKAHSSRPYSLAFDGATTKEMYHFLVHAQAVNSLKLVLLGLDTYHLTDAPGTSRPDYDPGLLNEGKPWDVLRKIMADLQLLTSLDTLRASASWLLGSQGVEADWLSPDGQRLGEVFFRRAGEDFQELGQRHYFDAVDKLEVQYQLEWRIPTKPIKVYPPPAVAVPDPISSFGYITKIIDFCRERNIALKIFISPTHAHQLQLSKAVGNWSRIERDKRRLVETLAQDGSPLYDFSDYSPVTTEPLPAVGSRGEMKYFWDSSHYKENVGDLVLECMLSPEMNQSCELGEAVNRENIDGFLEKINGHQREYEARFPDDVRVIDGYIADFKREHGITD